MKIMPWHICIIIPARNEEALLPRCLKSVICAGKALPSYCSFDISLAIDSSEDNSLAIGTELVAKYGQVFEIEEGVVGKVRMQATDAALKRYSGALEQCWLANTDADCEVPLHWLTYQLQQAITGVKAIAGIVAVDSFIEHDEQVPERFRETYILNEDGTHPHMHGANMGIRADTYLSVGGWNNISTAEDHDLWNRLKASHDFVESDVKLCVLTSGRRVGRAPDGFAQALAAHNKDVI
jgi:cellulose synthase/poly-beta-1,6-N-acetylglucosamine synthase-like glycosyltransferase